ncbi:hypothetical protein [Haloarcula sebkhae]|uniref:Uncharacterized protein n=2 Tax=Haloarcula sebkhae TaxID=932660 RepID=A0ACC6VK66_9EURY|nr:hypothetical protein [Haloarcula sebkhae]GGK69586.1 hypothetical protein GCM10009067_22230 [Haloarcula sebkhae]
MAGRVAVLLALLLFAGCGAFGGAERQTVTPVPVPEQSQDGRAAPAVTGDTVDARRLAAAHQRATRNRPYVLGMRLSLEWGTQIVSLVVEDRYHYQFRTEIVDQNYTKRVYTNGNRRYVYDERAEGAWTATRRPTPVAGYSTPTPLDSSKPTSRRTSASSTRGTTVTPVA